MRSKPNPLGRRLASAPRMRLAALSILLTVALSTTSCALLTSATPPVETAATTVTPTSDSTTASPVGTPAPSETTTPESPVATPQPSTATPEPPTATAEQPTATPSPAYPTVTAAPTATLPPSTERISFAPGETSALATGNLPASGETYFVLNLSAGQLAEIIATVNASSEGLSFTLVGADGTTVKPGSAGLQSAAFFRGTVPTTQDYTIALSGPAGSPYTLSIIVPIRIRFAPGATSAQLLGSLKANGIQHYVIRAAAGQTMTVQTLVGSDSLVMVVFGADGTVLQSDHAGASRFSGTLPSTQDYLIDLSNFTASVVDYTMRVTIPAQTQSTPMTPERITFAAGATSASVQSQLAANSEKDYVVHVEAGQLLEASVELGSGVTLAIQGADGTVVKAAGQPFFRGTVPTTQDYILKVTTSASAETYTLSVIIPVRISFASGAISGVAQATIPPTATENYVIRAVGGQQMTIDTSTTQGQVIVIVYGVDGTVLQTDHVGSSSFSGTLPSTQDYLIDVRSVGSLAADLTLTVTITSP